MKFGENLKALRKIRGLTQEDIAQMLGVSRQAVSKWEYSDGYPEMEKMIELSEKLGVSIDSLIKGETKVETPKEIPEDYKISITGYDGHLYFTREIRTSEIFLPAKNEPKYLITVPTGSRFLGEDIMDVLAYYKDIEDRNKEALEIMEAISNGENSYELKYNTPYKPNIFTSNPMLK